MGITKELVQKSQAKKTKQKTPQNLRPTPDMLHQNLDFNEVPEWFICTLKVTSTYLKMYLGIELKAWEHSP